MEWFNPFGLVFMLAIMIPNIIYAARHPEGFVNKWNCKAAELIEQIGRYGCFALMIFNIPGTGSGGGPTRSLPDTLSSTRCWYSFMSWHGASASANSRCFGLWCCRFCRR